MLTGEAPFHEEQDTSPDRDPNPITRIYTSIMSCQVPDIHTEHREIHEGVQQLIKKMLARDPRDRHATYAELLEHIDLLLSVVTPTQAETSE